MEVVEECDVVEEVEQRFLPQDEVWEPVEELQTLRDMTQPIVNYSAG